MPEVFKQKILRHLRHSDYSPVKLGQLAKSLGVGPEDYEQFKEAFEQLRAAGRVVIGSKSLVTLPPLSGRIIGTFRANPRGFGFVSPLEPSCHGDLFIAPGQTRDAMTGDTVVAKVVRKGVRGGQPRYSGKIVEVLERADNRFVGTLTRQGGNWLVLPEGNRFVEPIGVDDVSAKNAREKDKVVVEILTYPTREYLARGVITKVLGRSGRYETEINSTIEQYRLPVEFDEAALQQARAAAGAFDPDSSSGREDITDKLLITIDPPDAKDFDDAISLEVDSKGNRVLGVHIADVSCFVGGGTALDGEARVRGNSVYLPGRTLPMLPEILSNGVCSLQPGQKRFAKSVYLTYDEGGNVVSRRFANSVICSKQRLTYQQADKVLKGRTKTVKAAVAEMLKEMEALARTIENRRIKAGMLHLEIPETEVIFDKSGRVVDACPADTSYPHTIIEMFMVEANEAVAAFLDRQNVEFIRRIHPEPDSLSMKSLSQLVRAIGLSLPRNPDRFAIQELLSGVAGSEVSLAVNLAVLRSLEKAQYSPLHMGHYALASEHYCHFTSPIRRYADLLVHRLLQQCLEGDGKAARAAEEDLAETGRHLSFTEQRAEDAEQELKTVLILQMLADHVGEELDAVVTGLASFGVFVRSVRYGVEGLVRLEELAGDSWRYDAKTHCVLGQRTGHVIHLGQSMKVRITSVNVPGRQLNVVPAQAIAKAGHGRGRNKTGRRPARRGRRR